MPKAHVLINCQIGTQEKILNQLKKSARCSAEISEVNGIYDIVVKVYSPTLGCLKQTITQ